MCTIYRVDEAYIGGIDQPCWAIYEDRYDPDAYNTVTTHVATVTASREQADKIVDLLNTP